MNLLEFTLSGEAWREDDRTRTTRTTHTLKTGKEGFSDSTAIVIVEGGIKKVAGWTL